jgi:alanine racemase
VHAGLRPPWAHAANSAAILVRPDAALDMVRPGIALYGQPPSAAVAAPRAGLRPALRLDAPITFAKRVPAGAAISYGGTWVAPRATVVATVRLGYADGYPRSLSSRGVGAWRGRRVPVVGRVCMDQLMLDLGPGAEPEPGERIEFVGGAAPSAVEVAEAAGSFAYELLTGIGARVLRRYRSA